MPSLKDIDHLRNNIMANLKFIELNKHQFKRHDQSQLANYHNFILTILDNMINVKKVEMNDPYNSWATGKQTKATPAGSRTVVYNPDGTTTLIPTGKRSTGEPWERQFRQNVLNPPCYMMPPQNLYGIPQIKQASKENRLADLTDRKSVV